MATATHNGNGGAMRDRPLGELLKLLANETSTLVRKEIDLATTEMTEKGKLAGMGAGFLAAAAIVGVLAVACLTAAIILALSLAMPGWAAALIVGVVYVAGAAALAFAGKEKLKDASPPTPEATVETVQEDVRWAKAQLK